MPLSEEELRLLEQMERALVEEDPKLASTMRGTSVRPAGRRRLALAGLGFVLGVALLMTGAVTSQPVVGVIGFVVMLATALLGLAAFRPQQATPTSSSPRATGHAGFGVVDGGRAGRGRPAAGRNRPRGAFLDRMEQRWNRRREDGGF